MEILRSRVKQYYPTSDEEKLYETYKFEHEDWYPNHQLYLFNLEHELYCYVELFGTVQKYVHLSSEYSGHQLREKYLQKCTKWDFDKRKLICNSLSDLDIVARELDVEIRGKSLAVVQEKILEAARTRNYFINPDVQIQKVSSLIQSLLTYKITKIIGHSVVDQMMAKADAAKVRFTFDLVDKLQGDPLKALLFMRRDFNDFRIKNGLDSCPKSVDEIDHTTKLAYTSYKLFEFLVALDKDDVLEFKSAQQK